VDLAASPPKECSSITLHTQHPPPNTHYYSLSTPNRPERGDQQRTASTARSPPRPAESLSCSGVRILYTKRTYVPPALSDRGVEGIFFGILHAITVQPLHCLTFWDFAKPLSLSNGRSGPWLYCLPASLASFPITSHAHPPGCAASQCPGRLSHIATFHAGWSRMAGATLGRCNYPGTIPPNRSFPAVTEVGILSAAFLVHSMHFTD
jgi:hypothetical protein